MSIFQQDIKLQRGDVRLVAITPKRQEFLDEIAQNEAIWETFNANAINREDIKKAYALQPWHDFEIKKRYPLVIYEGDEIVGCSSYYSIDPKNLSLNIGYTWYLPKVWGTKVNPICKLLMLEYAFASLGMNRVIFTVDSQNQRSQHAMRKLGATEEGLMRQHIRRADGTFRDTVVFSILALEWPSVKANLEARVS